MHRTVPLALLMVCLPPLPPAGAQMTGAQRVEDFERLVNIFARNYGPYEWKRDRFGVDLYDVKPWLERVRRADSDFKALEVMAEYVASLRDTHSTFGLNSNFVARLPLTADVYGGRVLVDSVTTALLPAARFPIQIGDEVVSIDGRPVADWMREFQRLEGYAEERSGRRFAAGYLFLRAQSVLPRAFEIGDTASVTFNHRAGGTASYEIPWIKQGYPITRIGPTLSPFFAGPDAARAAPRAAEPWRLPFMEAYHNRSAPAHYRYLGLGARNPYYGMPAGFEQRLGRSSSDFHFSGTYQSGGRRIGLLRIPHFSPSNESAASRELLSEVTYLQANTDGLVLDVTRNTGGGCYAATALQLLIPYDFQLPADEIRATLSFLYYANADLANARAGRAEPWIIALLEQIVAQLQAALSENRGRTGPLPFCGLSFDWPAARGPQGQVLAYSKPLVLLADELTISWGDAFAAAIQDNGRGPVFGYRTNGAGGSVDGNAAGFYSETYASYSVTLGVRQRWVRTDDYGTTNVLENAGVRPDLPYDYMTEENLLTRGRPFVEAFTAAILAEIGKSGGGAR